MEKPRLVRHNHGSLTPNNNNLTFRSTTRPITNYLKCSGLQAQKLVGYRWQLNISRVDNGKDGTSEPNIKLLCTKTPACFLFAAAPSQITNQSGLRVFHHPNGMQLQSAIVNGDASAGEILRAVRVLPIRFAVPSRQRENGPVSDPQMPRWVSATHILRLLNWRNMHVALTRNRKQKGAPQMPL